MNPSSVKFPGFRPDDYFPFPKLKKWVGGGTSGSTDDIIVESNGFIDNLDKSYYLDRFKN